MPTTHWSLVLTAGQWGTEESAAALEQLCSIYWYPLYAHVRRRGYAPEDAQDLTQEFFARLLAKRWIGMADRTRGRFRTFVLSALDHFLISEWRREQCQKRAGAHQLISFDQCLAEDRYLAEPADDSTPERLFQQRWAAALLEQVLQQLRHEYDMAGRQHFFEAVKQQLWGDKASVPRSKLAADLGLTEGALKVAVHRLRRRYRELLRFEVAQTVSSPEAVDAELRDLMAVVGGA